MTRWADGRFVSPRAHVYALKYDDGVTEWVTALTPSLAVERRTRRMLPHTLTDTTVLAAWADGLGHPARTTPMLNRMYGPPELYQGPSVDENGWDRPAKVFVG